MYESLKLKLKPLLARVRKHKIIIAVTVALFIYQIARYAHAEMAGNVMVEPIIEVLIARLLGGDGE